MTSKKRIDIILVEKNHFETREKAKAHIMAGVVFVNDQKVNKAGEFFYEDCEIFIKKKLHPYVSRGGLKLEKAIKYWEIDFNNKIVVDVGSSTGGFTDCALEHGAKKVYAIDVGTDQLDYKIRQNEKVVVYEKTNFRFFDESLIKDKIDIVVMDVSFISIKLLVSKIYNILDDGGIGIFLIKPQFEVGRDAMLENGIVKDEKLHEKVVEDIKKFLQDCNFKLIGIIDSPILGQKGNKEFLFYIKK